jgi:SAM-dependent methyltransferase
MDVWKRNPWDRLAKTFGDASTSEDLPAHAADNVLVAWPPMLEFLDGRASAPARVLDFGCGGGRLVDELGRRGYEAVGIDSSKGMVTSAEAHFPKADVRLGDIEDLASLGTFDAVVSVMTLPFVDDIRATMAALAGALHDDGILVFAALNPDWVRDGMARDKFPPFVDNPNGRRTSVPLGGGTTVPIHIRTADEYDELAASHGFNRRLHTEPPFPDEYLSRYGTRVLANRYTQYLILGYDRR